MEPSLLDRMLNTYRAGQTRVTVTLQNRINISGTIKAFDSYVVIMDGRKSEVVYRHAIACLAPSIHDEQKRPAVQKPSQPKQGPAPAKYPASSPHKNKTTKPATRISASAENPGIGNTMKEGLLKWMQEHKADAK